MQFKNGVRNTFTIKVQTPKYKLSTKAKIGLGLTAGSVLTLSNLRVAFCKNAVNRTKDYDVQSNNTQADFDWKKFWSYLRPEMLWFIAAIVVSRPC